jgi:hypothetical protein
MSRVRSYELSWLAGHQLTGSDGQIATVVGDDARQTESPFYLTCHDGVFDVTSVNWPRLTGRIFLWEFRWSERGLLFCLSCPSGSCQPYKNVLCRDGTAAAMAGDV